MDTRPITETETVIADMLTENTGRHFLDSGGAYGRAWELNKSKVADSELSAAELFRSEPDAWWGHPGEAWVVVSLFHWLTERVDHATAEQHAFDAFDNLNPDQTWDEAIQGWLEYCERVRNATFGFEGDGTRENTGWYTYNDECNLSQDFIYHLYTAEGIDGYETSYVILQIHGGCDARGGFTAPKIFEYNDVDQTLYDQNQSGLYAEIVNSERVRAEAGEETLPDMQGPREDVHYSAWNSYGDIDGQAWPIDYTDPDYDALAVAWQEFGSCAYDKCRVDTAAEVPPDTMRWVDDANMVMWRGVEVTPCAQ